MHRLVAFILLTTLSIFPAHASSLNSSLEENAPFKKAIFTLRCDYQITQEDAKLLWSALKAFSTQEKFFKDLHYFYEGQQSLLFRVMNEEEKSHLKKFFTLNFKEIAMEYSPEYYSVASTVCPDVEPIKPIAVVLYMLAEETTENLLSYKQKLKYNKALQENLPALEATHALLQNMHYFTEQYDSFLYQLSHALHHIFPVLMNELQEYKTQRRIQKKSLVQTLDVSATFSQLGRCYATLLLQYQNSILNLKYPQFQSAQFKAAQASKNEASSLDYYKKTEELNLSPRGIDMPEIKHRKKKRLLNLKDNRTYSCNNLDSPTKSKKSSSKKDKKKEKEGDAA
jgi:hypothetical protein